MILWIRCGFLFEPIMFVLILFLSSAWLYVVRLLLACFAVVLQLPYGGIEREGDSGWVKFSKVACSRAKITISCLLVRDV